MKSIEQEVLEWQENAGLDLPTHVILSLLTRITETTKNNREKFDNLQKAAQNVVEAENQIFVSTEGVKRKSLHETIEELQKALDTSRDVEWFGRFMIHRAEDDVYVLSLVSPDHSREEVYEGTRQECMDTAEKMNGIIDKIVESEKMWVTFSYNHDRSDYDHFTCDYSTGPVFYRNGF